jgi:hypothetical protein
MKAQLCLKRSNVRSPVLSNFGAAISGMVSIRDYVIIEQEAEPTKAGLPPAYWPASGDLRVENLSNSGKHLTFLGRIALTHDLS